MQILLGDRKKVNRNRPNQLFPYLPSKFPWFRHGSHLHRLIPHFVQIRIQKFRCKAVGTDVFSGFLWGEPLAAVHFVVDMQRLCGSDESRKVTHQRVGRLTLQTLFSSAGYPLPFSSYVP